MVKEVWKTHYRNEKELHALKGVSFKIKKGEFVSIVGRSGSGKTTILNILGAMAKPSRGKVALNGRTLGSLSEGDLTKIRRDDIATIYQDYNLIPVLSAFQNIEFPMIIAGMTKEDRIKRTDKLLKMVGLEERGEHKPEELSGGERQRVTIARALSNRPGIILADEPTGDLDPEIGTGIVELLEGINRDLDTTLLIVTHDMELAKRADRVIRIHKGEIVEIIDGDGKQIREEEKSKRTPKDPSQY